jgi:hypothetical protein
MRSALHTISRPENFFFADLPPESTKLFEVPPALVEYFNPTQSVQGESFELLAFPQFHRHKHDGQCCTPPQLDTWESIERIAAENLIRGKLIQALNGIEDEVLREWLRGAARNDKELLTVLGHITPEARIGLCAELIGLSAQDEYAQSFFRDKIDNMLFYLSAGEKIALFERIEPRKQSSYAAGILRSAGSVAELENLSSALVQHSPALANSQTFKELQAQAWILTATAPYADMLEQIRSSDIVQHEKEIVSLFDEITKLIKNSPFAKTDAAKDILHSISDTKQRLLEDLKMGNELRGTILEREVASLRIELLYGVNISYGKSDYLGVLAARDACDYGDFGLFAPELADEQAVNELLRWRIDEIDAIEDVLRSISFRHLHFTAQLRDIELVSSLGRGVLGARYHADGRIKIANMTRDNVALEAHYEGVSSLKIVLAHEIGHGVQIGGTGGGFQRQPDGNYDFHPGEPEIDFDEYADLSGWTVYPKDRVAEGSNPWSITLDGVEYPLEQEIEHQGKKLMLLYNSWAGLLISFDAEADFSRRWYAKVSPWEDFAEAFSEYLYLPERLLQDAPEKFWHLERELRRYIGDERFYPGL